MKRNNEYLKENQFAKGNLPNKTSFKKGHKPWNVNKKGIHLSPATEFKKGQKPITYLPVGSEVIRIDKNRKARTWIKASDPDVWIMKSRFVWISNNGEIPKGLLIHHNDEDSLNDDISNLALMTRKAHFEIHKIGAMGRKALAEKNN
jgi:hypothetical protein